MLLGGKELRHNRRSAFQNIANFDLFLIDTRGMYDGNLGLYIYLYEEACSSFGSSSVPAADLFMIAYMMFSDLNLDSNIRIRI